MLTIAFRLTGLCAKKLSRMALNMYDMYDWVQQRAGLFEALAAEESGYVMAVEAQKGGGWIASVGGNEVDEGFVWPTFELAKEKAEASYNNYYSDFEDPI
jgi:hypothetical protein